ncbi:hypothetical protein JKP88DRAFT_248948 [Tribonema minus]|uniref:Uncharacterized protein n=1 Tax=Tribonema minus TaxID=303371 RepID=A0A836CAD6_9STRA|nr:hypothetical protein JKP88DRAFT_248948 [Tribonema minus]
MATGPTTEEAALVPANGIDDASVPFDPGICSKAYATVLLWASSLRNRLLQRASTTASREMQQRRAVKAPHRFGGIGGICGVLAPLTAAPKGHDLFTAVSNMVLATAPGLVYSSAGGAAVSVSTSNGQRSIAESPSAVECNMEAVQLIAVATAGACRLAEAVRRNAMVLVQHGTATAGITASTRCTALVPVQHSPMARRTAMTTRSIDPGEEATRNNGSYTGHTSGEGEAHTVGSSVAICKRRQGIQLCCAAWRRGQDTQCGCATRREERCTANGTRRSYAAEGAWSQWVAHRGGVGCSSRRCPCCRERPRTLDYILVTVDPGQVLAFSAVVAAVHADMWHVPLNACGSQRSSEPHGRAASHTVTAPGQRWSRENAAEFDLDVPPKGVKAQAEYRILAKSACNEEGGRSAACTSRRVALRPRHSRKGTSAQAACSGNFIILLYTCHAVQALHGSVPTAQAVLAHANVIPAAAHAPLLRGAAAARLQRPTGIAALQG